MKPIDFEGSNCTYAKDQPEYLPLPVCRDSSDEVRVMSCWELDEADVEVFKAQLERGEMPRLWLVTVTWGAALQPVGLSVTRPVVRSMES